MGSFCLFIKDDLATAYRQYWSKVISENPDSEKLKVCNISVIVVSYIYIRVQFEYIFQILTKGIVSSLVLVCNSYSRSQGELRTTKFMKYLCISMKTLFAY
jgi:hypothetical protein